ncbi:hypothetical protein [Halorubellus salinus]|uniref:hypothetical protein n=1 Tax=Halorubellus salinus TaxID=755309 RepID=UPI001D07D6D6|nr:hypothetical protein [Halorubellus salinus]
MDEEDTTRRRVLAAGGIASVFGLSGCLRLSQAESTGTATSDDSATTSADESTTDRATRTTEASTDTETESETTEDDGEATYPPGVSDDGVTEALVLEHRQRTTGQSRTVETEYMGFNRRTTKLDGSGRMRVESSRGPETYVEDRQLYQRLTLGGQAVYAYHDELRFDFRPTVLSGTDLLEALVRGGAFAPVGEQTRDGETLFILEADEMANASALEESRTVSRYFRQSEFPLSSFSGSALATEDGVVSEMEAFLQGDGDGGTFAVNTSDVGETTVTTPSWKDAAKREAATFDASLSADGSYIELVQTGGQAIGAETDVRFQIDAFDRADYFNGRYQGSTSEGATFYLYKTGETTDFGSPKLGVSKNSKPSTSPAGTWSSDSGVNVRVETLELADIPEVA